MNRLSAIPFVGHVVDDALNGRPIGADMHAIVREHGNPCTHESRLIGWQCGFEPMFVAVHSYYDCPINDQEAIELATEYLKEIGWFSGEPKEPDFIL
jgi:hypothetical protein